MNKKHYRLVFNKLRGALMAVAEHVASSGKSAMESSSSGVPPPTISTQQHLTLKPLIFSVKCRLGLVSVLGFSPLNNIAFADIIADPSALSSQRPIVLNAANGLPLVNIQTPSAAGVSRNVYSQFDVNNNGAILNNSRNNVQTQLGGFVQGNPYLAIGTARVILNEVNSQNPSLLHGYVEVAGSRAQVVIANPAGISCSGCGFINASRATLTTGTPQINGGDLIGYRVTGGNINILGAGLDASQTNYTDIIARAVNVNAGVWAQNLNVTTGANQVLVDTAGNSTSLSTIASSGSPPTVAIDVAALGGMFAGKIHLIGTEAGVGVRNAGAIGASVGEISIDVNGFLTNSNAAHTAIIASTTQTVINAQDIINTGGTISAGQLLNISANSLSGDGKLLSAGDATVSLNSDYNHTSSGELQAANMLSLTTTGNINNQAKILAGNTLTLNAVNIDNQASAELSGLDTLLNLSGNLSNRGLIDGRDTFINAAAINNIGTGSIFGDHVAIAASSLNNDVETVTTNNVVASSAAIIAARHLMDLGISNVLTNREHAMLFSAGDLNIAGALDANHQATVIAGQAQSSTLNNNSATIEALANISLNVANINNTNEHFSTQVVQVFNAPMQQYQLAPGDVHQPFDIISRYLPNEVTLYDCQALCITVNQSGNDSDQFIRYDFNRTVNETQIENSDPSQIVAGGTMQISANNLLNDKSKIVAGSSLTASINSLSNTDGAGARTITDNGSSSYFYRIRDKGRDSYGVSAAAYNPPTTIQAISLAPSQYLASTSPASVGLASGRTIATLTANTLPNNSLFHSNPNPAGNYLIETDPRLTNYRAWLSSDYMLTALAYDPALVTARLGDGFYEQKLVREQVAQLTGRRFLNGYANDELQYQALMMSGASIAQQFNLIPGIALSAAQVAQLTTDIVWLVQQQTIKLADGTSQQVLVPQVYVRVKDGDLNGNGALISADSTTINLVADMNNSNGTIAGRNLLVLNANNLNNLGGRLTADNVSVTAQNDLNIIGGTVDASDKLIATAGHDLNAISTTSTQTNSQGTRTNINRVAGLYVTGNQGLLVASADNDLALYAAKLINQAPTGAGGTTIISAANNLNLGTVNTRENNRIDWDSNNHLQQGSSQDNGTSIQTNGNIQLQAGNDANMKAATISSGDGSPANPGGAVNVLANNNINLNAGQATQTLDEAHQTKTKGFLSSRTFTTQDNVNQTNSIGSSLSADSITLQSGKDINVQGSNIVATQNTTFNASNNINITTAQNTDDETHLRDVKKSGLMSSGGLGFTIGKRQLTTTNDTQVISNTASTIGSINGDVNISSGKNYTQTGSDVLAPTGDINISAQQVNIVAAENTNNSQQTTKFKQSGLTFAVTNPVISAIQTAQEMGQAANQTKDTRMQALAAGTTALAASNAIDLINKTGNIPQLDDHGLQVLDANGKNSSENPANQFGGINLSISLGSSQSSSNSLQSSKTAQSSHVTAGNNINIIATGAGVNSDINVSGSQVKAANDVSLVAEHNINLIAAQNTSTQNSTNKSSSASIGISVGTSSGFAVTAGASKGKGNSNGTDITYTETQIQGGNQAGNRVALNSGTDTNLIGAQVSANQVIANVGTNPLNGGNLNIQSLQDTSTYQSKQSSAGFSISVPIGLGNYGGSISASKSNINSDYASVMEQSGIMAGEDGFQVNVHGNTKLTGAVIASTDKAIQDNKNSLATQTLTTSNIENKADYKADAMSMSAGVGLNKQPDGLLKNAPTASAGVASDSGNANSVTVSGVSNATVYLTDNTKQTALTGKDALSTVATLNRDVLVQNNIDGSSNVVDSAGNSTAHTIAPIFDKQKVERELNAAVIITQTFSQVAPKAVGDYASSKLNEANDKLKQANDSNNALNNEERLKLINEANDLKNAWGETGYARASLHTAIGGLIGSLEGSIGAGATALTVPAIAEQLAKLDIPAEVYQALTMAAGAVIGGATGGLAGAGTGLSEVANNYLSHLENLDREKAILDCNAGNAKACNQADTLYALDTQRDLALHAACDGDSGSNACRTATIEMRQAVGTYFAATQANKPISSAELEANPLLSGYTNKDELQSYVPLVQVSDQKLTKEELGNDDKSQGPNLYNGDPWGVINRDTHQNYVIVKVGDQWGVIGSSEDQVYTEKAGVNGMQNSPIYAPSLMGIHVEDAYAGTSAYTLSYVPNNSFTTDLLLSLGDKVSLGGLTTSSEANFLSQVLQNLQAKGQKVDWVAHSRGGPIFTQAVNITPGDLSGNSILFHAGANNELVTRRILDKAGIEYGIGTPDNPQPPYKNSDADIVPNIVGFNGNPIQMIRSILAIPDLSSGPLVSPHTLPPGYIVAPPRYTTPYSESAP
jgi:filamentous hemagglutinin